MKDALRRLLMEEWDPIGVHGAPGAEDEYDRYADQIGGMLAGGADIGEITRYLAFVETVQIGLVPRADRNLAVAERAVAIAKDG